jgi:hypothetical protein
MDQFLGAAVDLASFLPPKIFESACDCRTLSDHMMKNYVIYIYIIQDEKRGKSKTVRAFFPSPISFEFEDPDQLRSLRGPVKAAGPLVPKPKKVSVLTPTSRTRTKQLSKKIAELWLKKMIS